MQMIICLTPLSLRKNNKSFRTSIDPLDLTSALFENHRSKILFNQVVILIALYCAYVSRFRLGLFILLPRVYPQQPLMAPELKSLRNKCFLSG